MKKKKMKRKTTTTKPRSKQAAWPCCQSWLAKFGNVHRSLQKDQKKIKNKKNAWQKKNEQNLNKSRENTKTRIKVESLDCLNHFSLRAPRKVLDNRGLDVQNQCYTGLKNKQTHELGWTSIIEVNKQTNKKPPAENLEPNETLLFPRQQCRVARL